MGADIRPSRWGAILRSGSAEGFALEDLTIDCNMRGHKDVGCVTGAIDVGGSRTKVRSQFRIEPIPEPSTWTLMGLGLIGVWRFSVGRRTLTGEGNV